MQESAIVLMTILICQAIATEIEDQNLGFYTYGETGIIPCKFDDGPYWISNVTYINFYKNSAKIFK